MKRFCAFVCLLLIVTMVAAPTVAFGYTEVDTEGMDLDYYTQYKDQGLTLNVYNWGEYISDGEDDSLDVNKAFEELTGIDVVYSTYDTNESLYAKLKTGGASYDVIIPSDYMIARMIEEDMLLPLDFNNIPNFKYINEIYCNPAYDPENLYSVPYTWGTVGIIYNTTMVDPEEDMGTWKVLWSEKYADKILMFGNSKDAFGIAFKALGYPINAESMEQLEEATEYLKEQKKVVQAYVMDEIFDKMAGGEAAMAPYYAGDYLTMKNDNPDLAFSLPREGSNIFADAMCIPKDAKNKELAEMYINFMLEPEVGLANIEYIGYSTPNDAVYELLPEETKNDPVSYPSAEVLATCEPFLHITSELALAMDEKWTEILTDDQGYSNLLMPMLLAACVIAIIVLAVIRSMRKKRDQI